MSHEPDGSAQDQADLSNLTYKMRLADALGYADCAS